MNLNQVNSQPTGSTRTARSVGGLSVHDRVISLDAHDSGVIVGFGEDSEGKVIVRLSSGKRITCDAKNLKKDPSRQASQISNDPGVSVVRHESSKVRHVSRSSTASDPRPPFASETTTGILPSANTPLQPSPSFAQHDQVVTIHDVISANDDVPAVHIPEGSHGKVLDIDDDHGDILVDFEARGEHWLWKDDLDGVMKVAVGIPKGPTLHEAALSSRETARSSLEAPQPPREAPQLPREAVKDAILQEAALLHETAQPPRDASQPPREAAEVSNGEQAYDGRQSEVMFARGDSVVIRQDVVSANDETVPSRLHRGSVGHVLTIEEGDVLIDFAEYGRHWVSCDDVNDVHKVDTSPRELRGAKTTSHTEAAPAMLQKDVASSQTVAYMENVPLVPQRGIAQLQAEPVVPQIDIASLQAKHAVPQRDVASLHVESRLGQPPALFQRDTASLQAEGAVLQRGTVPLHTEHAVFQRDLPSSRVTPAVFQFEAVSPQRVPQRSPTVSPTGINSLQTVSRREQGLAVSHRDVDALLAELAHVRFERIEAEARFDRLCARLG